MGIARGKSYAIRVNAVSGDIFYLGRRNAFVEQVTDAIWFRTLDVATARMEEQQITSDDSVGFEIVEVKQAGRMA